MQLQTLIIVQRSYFFQIQKIKILQLLNLFDYHKILPVIRKTTYFFKTLQRCLTANMDISSLPTKNVVLLARGKDSV